MANISLDQLKVRILNDRVDRVTEDLFSDDDPWLFRSRPDAYPEIRSLVQSRLLASDIKCVVVGSAKFGYSISPDRFGFDFGPRSDVDIAVISDQMYNSIWNAMLEWRYPWHMRKWNERERRWGYSYLEDHFVGWISPDKIRVDTLGVKKIPEALQPFAISWFDTFKQVGSVDPVRGHDANARLFRSQSHLMMYQRWGLLKVKKQLEGHSNEI